MATTTNFGWETPDDTDLVKDGALAMRTLGNSIDSSFVDLKGGTTGQVLAKASNTDLDYTWVTQDDANAIQNAIVDAKGDLIAASAADTPARLAVGNNGETLVADSSTSTGLRWQGLNAAGKNVIFNSAFDIWQRGTSFAYPGGTTYTADRWTFGSGATGRTTSRQTSGLATSQYNIRCQRDSGNTNTATYKLSQSLESVDSRKFAGKTFTLSFQARAGANYSAASNALAVEVRTGTGTDQNIDSGYTGSASPVNQTATLTASWQRFTYTGTASSSATEIGVIFTATPVGTAGANDFFEIAEVQLEIGSVATEFARQTATLAGELAACQRYYQRFNYLANGIVIATMAQWSSTNGTGLMFLPVSLRVPPTSIDYSGIQFDRPGVGVFPTTSLTLSVNSGNTQIHLGATAASGLTAGSFGYISATTSTSYIGFSAEL